MGVSPDDRRPTGPVQRPKAARMWQRRLDQAVADGLAPGWREWAPLVEQLAPSVGEDSFAPILAGRLAAISRPGQTPRRCCGRLRPASRCQMIMPQRYSGSGSAAISTWPYLPKSTIPPAPPSHGNPDLPGSLAPIVRSSFRPARGGPH
jgi:hypothetical protein